MTNSNSPATSLLDSVLNAETARVDVGVAMLKKAQDIEKQQGAAMVGMLERSVQPAGGRRLDVYA
jgi:Putative motility protein